MSNNEIVQLKSYDENTGQEIGNVLPITNSEAVKTEDNKTLKQKLTEINKQIEQTNASLDNITKLSVENENVNLSRELLNNTGWSSEGWTGNWEQGFTHTVGENTPIRKSLRFSTGTKMYLVSMRLTPTCQLDGGNGTSDFTVSIGNSKPFITYQGKADTKVYSFGIQSVTDGDLVITPEPRYDGVISEISVKEILGTIESKLEIKDTKGEIAFEIRPGKASLKNLFIGKESGRYNISGNQNSIVGDNSMIFNTSGYWNSALGYMALLNNTVGSRNIAIGYATLKDNEGGDRNVAIGTFALCRNAYGRSNIGIGADSLWMNTTGNDNIGLGLASLGENTTGSDNIGLGKGACASNLVGNYNIALGRSALSYHTGSDAIGIGAWALFSNKSNGNTAIGSYSQRYNPNGFGNTSIGKNSLVNPISGSYNTAIGEEAGASPKNGNATISENTLIGFGAGKSLVTGGDKNTCIGTLAGAGITTGQRNIMIGRATEPLDLTDSNKLNIGDVIYGDLSTRKIMIGTKRQPTAILELREGGGIPGTAPLKFNNGALLSIPEPGTFEFNNGVLYFTCIAGQRKKVSLID